jgi:hypothetical protein
MKCKIFKGNLPTVEKDMNLFLEENKRQPYFKIISVTQSYSDISNLIVTIIYSY